MTLKDLMEEKQLNLNQPLLSVRRFASTLTSEGDYKRKTYDSLTRLPPSPSYKSELKSGPVRNAGNVPFVWEKAPGRPKDESKFQTQAVEQPLVTPNFPPGRVSKIKQQPVTEMRTGSTVPFLDKKVTKYESSKEKSKDKESSDSDDGDEAYVDALDTLSRTESFFMSCSVSGLSGWDEQQVQPSRSFSSDQQARDFMIDRFLPAAKAMTSEAPHYASKRVLVGQEQQKQKKKEVNTESSRPFDQHRPKPMPHYIQDVDREESDDESDDCLESENYTTTTCGLFPRFCLLNPIPGLRMVDKVPRNAVCGMQAKSAASHIESTKQQSRAPYGKNPADFRPGIAEEKDILGILVKSKHGTNPHQTGCSKLVSCESTQCDSSYESPAVEKTLYVDSVHKVKSQTNNTKGDFETKDGSIYKNPSIDSSLENSRRLDAVDVKAALQPKSSESLDSPFLVCSGISNNDMKMEMTNHLKKIDSERQGVTKPDNQGTEGSDLYQNLVVISSPKPVEYKKIYSSEKKYDILTQNSEVDLKSRLAAKLADQECTLASSKVGGDGKIDLESQYLKNLGHKEISDASCFRFPFALPSPKAPSESWLKRTLPTIAKRNITSRSNLIANIYARSQTSKITSPYPKWETIVKSSNVHHGHLYLPEELLTTIPED